MTWIGLRDGQDAVLAPGGLDLPHAGVPGSRRPGPAMYGPDEILPQGTLLIEFRYEASDRPVNILRYTRRDPAPTVLTLRADPDGTLALLMRQGPQDALHTVSLPGLIPGDTVIASYLWDAVAGRGVFAAHLPERGLLRIAELPGALPLRWRDADNIIAGGPACQTAPGVSLVALGTHLAPVGPQPVIDGAGLVDTPDGTRTVQALRLGDTVLAADGAPAQVRWIGGAVLPARGLCRPHLLRAPFLRVRSDLCLSGAAILRLGGSEVEYLFGDAEVAVPVRHLADRRAILPMGKGPGTPDHLPLTHRYYQIVLDRTVPLRISGVAVEALDTAELIARPALHRWSMLRAVPVELMPRVPASLCTRLRDYEARTLRNMQAA